MVAERAVPGLPILVEVLEGVHVGHVHVPVGVHHVALAEHRLERSAAGRAGEDVAQLRHRSINVVRALRPAAGLVVLLRPRGHGGMERRRQLREIELHRPVADELLQLVVVQQPRRRVRELVRALRDGADQLRAIGGCRR